MTEFIAEAELTNLDKIFLTITIKPRDRNSDKLVYMTDQGPMELAMTKNDITDLKKDSKKAFAELINQLQNGLKYEELSSTLLDPYNGLALSGYTALNSVFGPNGVAYLNQKFANVGDNDAPVVIINTDVVHIPWECIFVESPLDLQGKTLSTEDVIKRFWGIQFILARYELPTISSHGLQINLIDSYLNKPVTIGAAINDSLVFALSERNLFEMIENDPDNQVDVMLFQNQSNFISEFLSFLHHDDLHLLHIACHAEAVPGAPFNSYLQLSDKNVFLVKHLRSKFEHMKIQLIFLNACETGPDNPLGTIDFVRTFQKYKNVENVIATEDMVHSQVAEQIAITFYEHFLQGRPLGESLYVARKSALKGTEAKNIVSLFYSLHGNPFFHLKDLQNGGVSNG